MSAPKASFVELPPGRFVLGIDPAKEAYTGEERRVASRRTGRDRRVDERFSLTNPDRRQSASRRADDALPYHW